MSGVGGPSERLTVMWEGRRLEVHHDRPLVFGRADIGDEVIGLDPTDMGISAVAGAVERVWDIWWVHNRSTKRILLLEENAGMPPRRLACGDRHAISSSQLNILVPGVTLTHRLVVSAPAAYLERLRQAPSVTSGTVSGDDVRLSERDLDVLVAMLAGFLEPFPRYKPHPATYAEAAARLGQPWDSNRVRKQVERIRGRLAGVGVYIDGDRANYDLADFLINNKLITVGDLVRLERPSLSNP